jgi:tetratricopeptide (TPR) repeat protein
VDLARLKNYPEAEAHYRAALALDSESATALNNLARILHSQGQLDEAIEDYSRALRIDPELAEARNNLGVLLLQKGRVDEAVPQLRQAFRVNPSDPQTQYNLAMALNQQQAWSEASQFFSKLAPANLQDANLYCQFGLALGHTGKTREAMSAYAHALLLQPDFPQALDQLAWILSTDSHPEFRNGPQAVAMAERACELTGKKDPETLKTLAAAYAEAGRFLDAVPTAHNAWDLASHAGQRGVAAKCQKLLESFKEEKPWRESP